MDGLHKTDGNAGSRKAFIRKGKLRTRNEGERFYQQMFGNRNEEGDGTAESAGSVDGRRGDDLPDSSGRTVGPPGTSTGTDGTHEHADMHMSGGDGPSNTSTGPTATPEETQHSTAKADSDPIEPSRPGSALQPAKNDDNIESHGVHTQDSFSRPAVREGSLSVHGTPEGYTETRQRAEEEARDSHSRIQGDETIERGSKRERRASKKRLRLLRRAKRSTEEKLRLILVGFLVVQSIVSRP